MADVTLAVGGREYGGWTAVRVSRGIESVAGSFDLGLTERWYGQDAPWPIVEGDRCVVAIEGQAVITGYVDKRSHTIQPDDHSISVTGRDATADMVDCSALIGTWELLATPLDRLATLLAKPFAVPVSFEPGVRLPAPQERQVINPGDTVFDTLERACRFAGVLAIPDGLGGLRITAPGTKRATTPLIEGVNILQATLDRDAAGRFARYVVTGQKPGSDTASGADVAAVTGEARDANVTRQARVLVLHAEGDITPAYARQRAEWEATVRAARARQLKVTVQGWTQASGALWPINALVTVCSPRLGLDEEMLITEVAYGLSEDEGTTTQLTVTGPKAFTPQPIVQQDAATRRFTELDHIS